MANSSFSNMIDHKDKKGLYSYLQKCISGKDILLKLYLAILEKGFWMASTIIQPTNSYISES